MRATKIALGDGEARLRLGHIGARQVADLESVARCIDVDREHVHLVGRKGDQCLAAQNVHVSGDDLAEDGAFGGAQIGPAGIDTFLGGSNGILDRSARIDRDAEIDPGSQRTAGCEETGRVLLEDLGISRAGIDRGQPGRAFQRDAGVGRPQLGARSLEGRVIQIGVRQRFLKRVCLCNTLRYG